MFKRIITLFLAVAMVVAMGSLAGCKSKKPATTQGNTVGLNKTEEAYFLDMPEDLVGTTVKFATWIDHAATDTAIALTGFEITTGMSYELVSVKQSDYIPKMTSLIASDQSPDVAVENGDFPKTLNILQPLSLETNGLDPTDPFWDQDVSEYFKVGDCYYMVIGKNCSWHRGGAMVYYNKTMLAENGVKDPAAYIAEDNWNLDTLWTLMTQIKSTCNLERPGTCITFDDFIASYGGNQVIFDTATDKFVNTLKSAETRKAIDYLMKAKDQGIAKIVGDWDNSGLAQGKGAMAICGAYGLKAQPGWFYQMDIADLGFAKMPKENAGDANYVYTTNIRAYGICKGAPNARGAAYFLRYFLNEDNYDLSQVFKNEEARALNKELRENQVIATMPVSLGVGRVVDPSYKSTTLVQDLIDGTAAQVNVNIDIVNNKLQAAVNDANKLIDDVIANQK